MSKQHELVEHHHRLIKIRQCQGFANLICKEELARGLLKTALVKKRKLCKERQIYVRIHVEMSKNGLS